MHLLLAPFAALTGLTSWYFVIDASILTSYFIYTSYNFYKKPSNETAMKTFRTSLWYLPAFLILLFIHLNFENGEDEEDAELDDLAIA